MIYQHTNLERLFSRGAHAYELHGCRYVIARTLPLHMLASSHVGCCSLLQDLASSHGKRTSKPVVFNVQLCTQVSDVIMPCWHLLAQHWSIHGAAEA